MSKLLQRLSDPARSGVYRVTHDEDVRDALDGAQHDVAAVALAPGKTAILRAIARALAFPGWFGENWDALEDCLSDLSWREGSAHVILFSGAASVEAEQRGVLLEILTGCANGWRERGRPFFAIFVDPDVSLSLPTLYREKER